jgi:CubicO group peptidase (beta-lactamase class C family)
MEQTPRLVKPSRRAVLSTAAAGALVPSTVLAQQDPALPQQGELPRQTVENALPKLQQLAEDARQRNGIPGMAIAVVYKREVIYLEGFGVRETGKSAAVDPDTVFQLASVSKPIAATVVAALVGEGVVAWDDPIVRHDPGFEMHDSWVTRQVTLRDMFAHRSGLPDHAGDILEDIGYDRAAILYRLRYQKPDSSFRSRYAYTNFGWTEAAVAAAMAAGRSWEDVSAERLYRPLGMTHTSSRFADFAAAANRASGHVRLDGKWVARYTRDADAQSPAGGASSSARDMAMWLRLQLGGGKHAGKQIVAAEPLDETHRPQIVRTPPKSPAVDHAGFYGLGWNIDYDAEGRVRWSHSGGFDLGAATSVALLPAQQLGIVALTNAQPSGVPEAVSRSFFDIVLAGEVEKDWLALYGQLMATTLAPDYGTAIDYAKPPAQPSPPSPAAAYAATYRNDLYGPIAVTASDQGLVLKLGPAPQPFPMQHFDRDVFTYQPGGENAAGLSAVIFTIAADQRANAVTIEYLDTNGQGTFTRTPAVK